MTSVLEAQQAIGKLATYLRCPASDGLRFDVMIEDAKIVYGRPLYRIVPVSGTGTVWVTGQSLVITTEEV